MYTCPPRWWNPVSSADREVSSSQIHVLGSLVSYGGHEQETRDAPADTIPPHPTGVKETIVVEDGVNQARLTHSAVG
jgi:hypothetical protein